MRIGPGNRLNRRGLTLVELLVSVALTVFLLTLFATLFASGNEALRNAKGVSAVDQKVRDAIGKLRRDLQNVYLGDGVSLARIYERYGPQQGYFTIEENTPASPPAVLGDPNATSNGMLAASPQILQTLYPVLNTAPNNPMLYRQGIDERGMPVEIDVDDVIAFTVRLTANSPENIFIGRVPVNSVLDNGFSPESRFDQAGNGLFTSPLAEVVYFLRPARPYTLEELNAPVFGSTGPQSQERRLVSPPTYTLHRRELLLLSEGQRRSLETPAATGALPTGGVYPLDDMASPNVQAANSFTNPSFYQHYDVSAYYGYDPRQATPFTLRWNDPTTIRQRRNRYGMQWMQHLTSGNIPPDDPDGAVPAYNHVPPVSSADDREGMRFHFPINPFVGGQVLWMGRPTLFESTLIGSEGISEANYSPQNRGIFAGLSPAILTAGSASLGNTPSEFRRSGNDVLLENVLSFDVKVLNDDVVPGSVAAATIASAVSGFEQGSLNLAYEPFKAPDPKDWPGVFTMLLAPLDPYQFAAAAAATPPARFGFPVGNTSRRFIPDPTNQYPVMSVQTDFVDLGASFAPELHPQAIPSGPPPTPPFALNPQIARYVFEHPSSPPIPPPAPNVYTIRWGQQTAARWISTGRQESSTFIYNTNLQPLRNVYDTWAPEYSPAEFVSRQVPPVSPTLAYTPPYDRPLRGLQITIRVLEPRSGIEREFQIVQRFE